MWSNNLCVPIPTCPSHDVVLVYSSDIDCSFFLVTVDLWSADGKSEMNLVLHPSSADRYVPPHIAKPRRRGASISAPQQRSGYQTPASRSTPTPSHYRSADNVSRESMRFSHLMVF